MRTLLFAALLAACECVHSQTACSGIVFRTSSSADLKPGGSRIRLIRPSGGGYTGYETADAAPHRILQTIPDFQTRVTPCAPPADDNVYVTPEVSARLADGRYLFVGGTRAALFDASMNFLAEADLPDSGGALVDLDRDGVLDIVAVTQVSRLFGIAVHRGLGGVSFQSPAIYSATFYHIFGVSTADLDGDGRPDVLVSAESGIYALYGTGDGALEPPVALAPAVGASVAIADLNRDGKPDLVFSSANDGIAVALGRGNRSFADPVKYPAIGFDSTAIGDLDGDGNLDIVTSGVTILYGDGAGAFPRRRDYWNRDTGSVFLADFDRDGRTDIVIGGGSVDAISARRVAVFFNRGADFIGAPVSRLSGLSIAIADAVSADFNRDGVPDLAISDESQLRVLTGNRAGGFTAGFHAALTWSRLAAADFNGDGFPDLVATDGAETGASLVLFLGRGNGDFSAPLRLPLPSRYGIGPVSGDFNGDGKLDIAVISDDLLVYPGDGRGGFAAPTRYPIGWQIRAMVAGDFNGDGRSDLAIAGMSGGVVVLFNLPNGGFSQTPLVTSSEPFTLATADLNRDGRSDLVLADVNNALMNILLARADGSFVESGLSPIAGARSGVSGLLTADLDGDGAIDIVDGVYPGPIAFPGSGDGALRQGIAVPLPFGLWLSADVDGDGRLDLITVTMSGITTCFNASQPLAPFTVVSSASMAAGTVAADSLATLFGSRFAYSTISVRDSAGAIRPAQILYTTDTQINFVMPAGTAIGDAIVTVTTPTAVRSAPVVIGAVAPSVFPWDASGVAAFWITRIAADGTRTEKLGGADPIDLGPPGDQVYLTFYGTGIRAAGEVRVEVQGVAAPVLYAGPQAVIAGLDQVNILLPRELAGAGQSAVFLTADGIAANRVHLNIR